MKSNLTHACIVVSGLLTGPAFGAVTILTQEASCFIFDVKDSPEAIELGSELSSESWCYVPVRTESGNSTFIFNNDSHAVKPELSVLVDYDLEEKPKSIVMGSLSKGEIDLVRSNVRDWNPLWIPLSAREASFQSTAIQMNINSVQVNAMIERFIATRPLEYRVTALTEGTFESMLSANKLPFDGYWWPHNGLPLSTGQDSPLGKYDRYVRHRTGTNPNSVEWENQYHSLQHVPWGGHCNGWAASSVLFKERPGPLRHAASGIEFSVSDINGILSESSFCVNWAFYGSRNNSTADDRTDIAPDRFHKVLEYYIDTLEKPVALDKYSDATVDNAVMTGYRFVITRVADQANTFLVNATIRTHDYESSRNNNVGTAVSHNRNYQYRLTTNSNGTITGGTWLSSNPDFLWVPLSSAECGRENPRIKDRFVTEIMNLPISED